MRNAAAQYLAIPEDYARYLDGLRWSHTGEAVETGSGATFAFAPQIWQFLEGFISVGPPPHFAHVLHLLHLLGVGPITLIPPQVEELRRAFLLAGRPLRNAGIFCAELCREVPPAAHGPERLQLRQELLYQTGRDARGSEMVSVPFAAFQKRVVAALERFEAADLLDWMKFGQTPPGEAGKRLAEEFTRRPPNLLAALAAAAQDSERLAGALSLVTTLSGALTIPPRRLDSAALPVGGYADVTTRGDPERLLLSQHALEGDEFVRRFAEHELLYFRREEPSDPTREELVVLLDQGVRTWGGVRLGLSGAVFAFARLAARRKVPFRLATTANRGESVDPLELDTAALTQMLEASDLSAGPGEALESLLGERAEVLRDVVLLTHPRSLGGDELAAVAALQPEGHRLFAVSLDSEGRGRLDVLRDGRPLPLSRFRVDLGEALDPPEAARPAAAATSTQPWTGDAEPVPFPFWFGPVKGIRHICFDHSGEWLLAATENGLLHAQRVDGSRREVLPRGILHGEVLSEIDAILGTSDGFVACGRYGLAAESFPLLVAFHYRFEGREVRAYAFPAKDLTSPRWFSFPDLHSIACRSGAEKWGVDLGTGGLFPGPAAAPDLVGRAADAIARIRFRNTPTPLVAPEAAAMPEDLRYTLGQTDAIWMELHGVDPPWGRFSPLFDGQPLTESSHMIDVQFAGDVLAVHAKLQHPIGSRLLFIRGPEPVVIRELPLSKKARFRLSDDGSRAAMQTERLREVSVFETSGGGPALAVMTAGLCHNNIEVQLGPNWLGVCIGRFRHAFRWSAETLRHERSTSGAPPTDSDETPLELPEQDNSGTLSLLTRYDPARFRARAANDRLRVETDRFGHVLVTDAAGERLIAMFWFQRDKAAAWLPDGTRWGAPALAGEVTPGAAGRIAAALRLE